jgi:hypothetical protein
MIDLIHMRARRKKTETVENKSPLPYLTIHTNSPREYPRDRIAMCRRNAPMNERPVFVLPTAK